jgi:cardiolipin synthase
MEGRMEFALAVFITAAVSDGLDGFLARVLNQKTLTGAYLDPIADKLLLVTSYVTLAILEKLPGWFAVIVVSRDVIIVGGIGILMLMKKTLAIKPTLLSKVTTFFQLITVCSLLGSSYLQGVRFLFDYLMFLTVLFTVLSCFHYLYIGFQILGREEDI